MKYYREFFNKDLTNKIRIIIHTSLAIGIRIYFFNDNDDFGFGFQIPFIDSEIIFYKDNEE